MDLKKADLSIHIDEVLEPALMASLVDDLTHLGGVLGVHSGMDQEHDVLVEYNTYACSSREILNRLQGQALHAHLMGF
jgi:hypothetical protein